ncbi:hypothetical protein OUY22_15460 [Nonomuraea sp. MCN248]|uniref:Uncharacterized protein n=1 Tax=Nonomuraea corallina TaxID=2989783 RepID=A0ABT4SCY1_9ACTN|nr:hypothetical protein [Nonomuraea corallina]MDA0634820.1 hypothetical protein [Nonomuraea corallina]
MSSEHRRGQGGDGEHQQVVGVSGEEPQRPAMEVDRPAESDLDLRLIFVTLFSTNHQ